MDFRGNYVRLSQDLCADPENFSGRVRGIIVFAGGGGGVDLRHIFDNFTIWI